MLLTSNADILTAASDWFVDDVLEDVLLDCAKADIEVIPMITYGAMARLMAVVMIAFG